jgi:hypothetical protein
MGGNHLTSDDIFIAAEKSLREKEKERFKVLKKNCERLSSIEAQRKLVIKNKGTDCNGRNIIRLKSGKRYRRNN